VRLQVYRSETMKLYRNIVRALLDAAGHTA
jgi:hypothetical protein